MAARSGKVSNGTARRRQAGKVSRANVPDNPSVTVTPPPLFRLASEDIEALAKAIANAIHFKFRSPNFQFDVLSRLPFSQDSVDYVAQNMQKAMKIEGKEKHLRQNINKIGAGLVLEFGVFRGQSINWLASWLPDRTIHGFDSFQGLPEDWLGYNVSAAHFDQGGSIPVVAKNVRLHKGWFDETVPKFLKETPGEVAFIHIDCDLYISTKVALTQLAGRIKPGTIIAFDEYHNYPHWREHEHKAFMEFKDEHKISFTYVSYNNIAAAVRIDAIGS